MGRRSRLAALNVATPPPAAAHTSACCRCCRCDTGRSPTAKATINDAHACKGSLQLDSTCSPASAKHGSSIRLDPGGLGVTYSLPLPPPLSNPSAIWRLQWCQLVFQWQPQQPRACTVSKEPAVCADEAQRWRRQKKKKSTEGWTGVRTGCKRGLWSWRCRDDAREFWAVHPCTTRGLATPLMPRRLCPAACIVHAFVHATAHTCRHMYMRSNTSPPPTAPCCLLP